MGEPRQRYSEEFKRQTVQFIQEQTKTASQIAEELKIPSSTIHQWLSKYREFENETVAAPEKIRQLEQRLKEKDRENADLKEEIAILKKAMHIFSKEKQ